jgi:integrase
MLNKSNKSELKKKDRDGPKAEFDFEALIREHKKTEWGKQPTTFLSKLLMTPEQSEAYHKDRILQLERLFQKYGIDPDGQHAWRAPGSVLAFCPGTRTRWHLQPIHVRKFLEQKKPYAQKNWLKTLRGLMLFAAAQNYRADDPTKDVRPVKVSKSRGHMTWEHPEIEAYRNTHALGTVARLAIELMLNIAARRGDAWELGPQHVKDGKLCWRPNKTKRSTGKLLSIPILPEFQAALDAMPAFKDAAFLVTDYGRRFKSAAAFGNKFADWCREAGLKPVKCDDGKVRSYRAHGLRKAALMALVRARCDIWEIMAVSGHSTLSQVQVYIDEFNREQKAEDAMNKLAAARR